MTQREGKLAELEIAVQEQKNHFPKQLANCWEEWIQII